MNALTSATTEIIRRHRDRDAEMFLLYVRPFVGIIALVLVLAYSMTHPGEVDNRLQALAAGLAAVGLLIRWLPARSGVNFALGATIFCDLCFVGAWVVISDSHSTAAANFFWPIMIAVYFTSARITLAVSSVALMVVGGLWAALPEWNERQNFPEIAFTLTALGILGAIIRHQWLQAEHTLAKEQAADKVALGIVENVRATSDMKDLLCKLAERLGRALNLDGVRVKAYPPGVPVEYVSWSAGAAAAAFDENTDPDRVTGKEATPFEHGDTLVMPLEWRGEAIGHVLMTGHQATWQSDSNMLLRRISPIVSSGIAQAADAISTRATLQALKRAEKMREHLIATVSHELRTPLTSTIGFIETLQRDDIELPEQMRDELLEYAREGGERLLGLVEDLLEISRLENGSLDMHCEDQELEQVITESLQNIDKDNDNPLHIDVEGELIIYADRARMVQVITNLITNSQRHGAGAISVHATRSGNSIHIDVSDEGEGVAERHIPQLFIPFARFSSRSDSTGLGLAISRAIARAHGGELVYLPGGTGQPHRFRLILPWTSTQEHEDADPHSGDAQLAPA